MVEGWAPAANLRMCVFGSGSDMLQIPEAVAAILETVEKDPADTNVLYIGTATYDLPIPFSNQTRLLEQAGCKVESL